MLLILSLCVNGQNYDFIPSDWENCRAKSYSKQMSCLGLNIKVYVCNFRSIKLVSLNQSSNCCKYADRWAKEILSDLVNFHRFLHCELRIANAQCSTVKLFQEKVIPILFFFLIIMKICFFFDFFLLKSELSVHVVSCIKKTFIFHSLTKHVLVSIAKTEVIC